jgi:hypothetical protein
VNKFIRKDDEFKQLFLDENKKRSSNFHQGSLDPRYITQCKRRQAYRFFGEKKEGDKLYFDICHHLAIVDKWVNYFKDCKKTHVVEEHAIVADSELNLKGIADVLIQYEEIIHGVNIRSVNSETFSKIQEKGGRRKDVIDLMACIWMAEVPFGILIYENNESQEIEVFEVKKSDLIINEVQDICRELVPYQLRGNLPNRDYKDSTSAECSVCEYRNVCFKKG